MPKLSFSEVAKTAKLAKLKISSSQVKLFSIQLSEVIAYFEDLKRFDTKNIESTSRTTELINKFRADLINATNCLDVKSALSGTKNTVNNLFKVPRIINK